MSGEQLVPDELGDRQADGWEPLFAIAATAGSQWPARARSAAIHLSKGREPDEQSLGIRLLHDCRVVFDQTGAEQLFTHDLLRDLLAIEEAPWGDLRGRPLTPQKLAGLLRKYDVRPKGTLRSGRRTAKGYDRSAFDDAWYRYLPRPQPNPEPSHRHTSHPDGSENVTANTSVTIEPSRPIQPTHQDDPSSKDGDDVTE